MTQPHQSRPANPDIDLPTLGRPLWRAKRTILGLAIGAGALTFIVLSMMRPLYTSEARILIQNDESAFTADNQTRDVQQPILDEQAVQSQVQVLTSRDLAVKMINDLNGSLSLLVAVATALLAISYILARELIGAPAERREPARAAEPRARERRRASPTEPAPAPAAASGAPAASAAKVPQPTAARKTEPTIAALPKVERKTEPTQSAAGFLERLRRGLVPGDTQTAAPQPQGGWLRRIRPARPATGGADAEDQGSTSPTSGNMPVLRTNDLRHYLNQRLAASAAEAANDSPRKGNATPSKPDGDKVGPVLKSLDAVLNHILASGNGGAPRALLVAGATAKLDATAEAIAIARALVARREQVVLVDLTRGPVSISGALGLPRTPGLTDLVAGRAGFEAVVRIDEDSSLQVISAGNPKLSAKDDENERFARLFEALTQTYDRVALHADREAVRQLTPALKFELPIVVAVLPAGATDSGTKTDLAEFSALGCPVLVYEQNGKKPLSRFFERVAAV